MITKTQMKVKALWAQAWGLEEKAATLRLHDLGLSASQKDVNKLRAYLLSEAGKLRAKALGAEDADKNRKLKRLIGEENGSTEVPAQGMQKEA